MSTTPMIEVSNNLLPPNAQLRTVVFEKPSTEVKEDRLLNFVSESLTAMSMARDPNITRAVTVNVAEYADGTIAYGLVSATPKEIKTIGNVVGRNEFPISLEFRQDLEQMFQSFAQRTNTTELPGLTIQKPEGYNHEQH